MHNKAIRCRTDSTQKVLNTDGDKRTCRKGGAENERPEKYQSQLTSATTVTAAAGADRLCAIIYWWHVGSQRQTFCDVCLVSLCNHVVRPLMFLSNVCRRCIQMAVL